MEIQADKLHMTYGTITILEEISFSLGKGQKIGLIGYNGTGKTTLLRILAGLIQPDAGEVMTRKDLVVGYMPQDTSVVSNDTISDYIRRVAGMALLEEQMGTSEKALLEYERCHGYTFSHRMEMMLAGFGLADISQERTMNSLSSGQKSKVFMSGVLLSDPDVLLLDEPTNNLDLPALIWLEDYLKRSRAVVMVVSHDRLFLDRVVRKIFEIDWCTRTLNITNGRYSDYLVRKEKEAARQWREYETQQEEIKRLEEQAKAKKQEALRGARYVGTDNDKFLRGFKRDRAGKSGKRAKTIEKRIEQMEIVEKPIERSVFRIYLQPIKPKGTLDITLSDVVAGYSREGFQVGPISLMIPYGSRLVVLGLNGSGKTTLLRTISGELMPLQGNVSFGKSLKLGNLTQEHDNLPRGMSIKEFLIQRAALAIKDAYALAVQSGFKAVVRWTASSRQLYTGFHEQDLDLFRSWIRRKFDTFGTYQVSS